MNKSKKLIIVGIGEIAEMAMEYFQDDSEYDVVAFAAERKYLEKHTMDTLCDLPVVFLENVNEVYPPDVYTIFVALGYNKLNHGRANIYNKVKKLGYKFASYISSKTFIGRNVEIGENCFILENNVIQRGVHIGDDVFIWSGNHIGHKSCINDHVFMSSHVSISGYCIVDEYSFLGINACLGDHVMISKNCFIGGGVSIMDNTGENEVYRQAKCMPERLTAEFVFGF